MAKVLDSSLELSKFELQSRYYVHFGCDTLGDRYGLNNAFGIK